MIGQAVDEILLPVQKAQPARLVFFNDADHHPVNHGQAPALEARQQGLAFGVVGRRLGVVFIKTGAVAGVALQHHLGAAPPLRQPKGAGAHRVLGDLVAVGQHHVMRQRTEQAVVGKQLDQARARLYRGELQGVAVDGLQAGHVGAVVEGRAAVQRTLAHGAQADEAGLFHLAPAG